MRQPLPYAKKMASPIIVFDLGVVGNIRRVVMGESIGTYVGGSCEVN